ncbi:hypothetical protein V8D89_008936 [Ganoderma adspersum]
MLVPECVVAFVVPVFVSPCPSSVLFSLELAVLVLVVALRLRRSLWLRLRLWFGCGWLCLHTEQARAVEVSGVRRDAFGRMMPRPRGNFGRYCPGQPGAGIPVKKLNILAPGLRAWGRADETGYTPRSSLQWAETSLLYLTLCS